MMTQEEFMDVVALRRQGFTITDIAAKVGRGMVKFCGSKSRHGHAATRVISSQAVAERVGAQQACSFRSTIVAGSSLFRTWRGARLTPGCDRPPPR
jgi:hypothetical protein